MTSSNKLAYNLTPNQTIAHTNIGVRKHPMTLRRRAPKTIAIDKDKLDLSKKPNNSFHLLRDCKVVLEDICFKNFNFVNSSTKSSKMNALVDRFNCKVLLTDIKDHVISQNTSQINELKYLQQTCGNGQSVRFTRCNSRKCKFQFKFFPADYVVSSVTLRKYACVRPCSNEYVNCHSSNVVYLITCLKCALQYVGETSQKLNERFAFHLTCLLHPEKYAFCKILNKHFNEGHCKGADYTVTILEKLPGNGRNERGKMDFVMKKERKAREKHWIMKMRTAFPFGLNDRIDDEYKKYEHKQCVHKAFPPLDRKFARVSRGINRSGVSILSPSDFKTQLDTCLTENISCAMNFVRVSLSSMSTQNLKSTHPIFVDACSSVPNQFKQWYQAGLDIIESKTVPDKPHKPKKARPKNICSIFFDNKAVEMINFSKIVKDVSLVACLPSIPTKFESPMITYKLRGPISSKIFNYNKFVKSIDVDQALADDSRFPCSCHDSEFKDNFHDHIITGDLGIVQNAKLRNLLSKGPKYREPIPINFPDAKDAIITGMKECVSKWCDKHALDNIIMAPYMDAINSLLDSRIELLEQQEHPTIYNIFDDFQVRNNLKRLQDKFVIVPIDKASGNVAFICKRFYARVIFEELGLNQVDGSETYTAVDEDCDSITSRHKSFLRDKFGQSSLDASDKLPSIYWLPKLHKSPVKFRFIIAAPECSIKPLARSITSIFKLFQQQIRKYNEISSFYSGIKTFWVIQDNKPVLDTMKHVNRYRKARTIETFDFSTLYTKIPHDKLTDVLCKLVDFCFEGGPHEFISTNDWGARWVSDPSSYDFVYDKVKIKLAIRYLMSNCYFTFGNRIFRQVIGIPMGSDPAPFFANLFLYFYESKWIRNLQRHDLHRARKFSLIFRFIDDLLTINDDGEFARSFREIYPPELQLNKENEGTDKASFLDLDNKLEDQKFVTSLYDKRNAFPFSIVRMPFLSSNIPSNMFYFSFGAEILRIARVSSSRDKFVRTAITLVHRIIAQGGKPNRMKRVLGKIFASHSDSFTHLFNEATMLFTILN